MNELHLFASTGGGILGGQLLGHTTVCAVEIEDYRRQVLLQRQRDGVFPKVPIWDDVETFDGTPWLNKVNILCAGFPCQDISLIGEGDGLEGERSQLWGQVPRIVRQLRPDFLHLENSPALITRGLKRILGEIAELGYDARWAVLGGKHFGLSIQRERLWILASSTEKRLQGWHRQLAQRREVAKRRIEALVKSQAWPDLSNPRAFGSADVSTNRADRLKAIGDGQIPIVAACSWLLLGGE